VRWAFWRHSDPASASVASGSSTNPVRPQGRQWTALPVLSTTIRSRGRVIHTPWSPPTTTLLSIPAVAPSSLTHTGRLRHITRPRPTEAAGFGVPDSDRVELAQRHTDTTDHDGATSTPVRILPVVDTPRRRVPIVLPAADNADRAPLTVVTAPRVLAPQVADPPFQASAFERQITLSTAVPPWMAAAPQPIPEPPPRLPLVPFTSPVAILRGASPETYDPISPSVRASVEPRLVEPAIPLFVAASQVSAVGEDSAASQEHSSPSVGHRRASLGQSRRLGLHPRLPVPPEPGVNHENFRAPETTESASLESGLGRSLPQPPAPSADPPAADARAPEPSPAAASSDTPSPFASSGLDMLRALAAQQGDDTEKTTPTLPKPDRSDPRLPPPPTTAAAIAGADDALADSTRIYARRPGLGPPLRRRPQPWVTDSFTESVTESYTDSVTESVTDPATDPVTDPVTDSTMPPVPAAATTGSAQVAGPRRPRASFIDRPAADHFPRDPQDAATAINEPMTETPGRPDDGDISEPASPPSSSGHADGDFAERTATSAPRQSPFANPAWPGSTGADAGAPSPWSSVSSFSAVPAPTHTSSGEVSRHRIPTSIARRFKALSGHDVSSVPVLRGQQVGRHAATIGARAFTAAGAIHLPDAIGSMSHPDTQSVIAHELTHVLQQRSGALGSQVETSAIGLGLEAEARSTAAQWDRMDYPSVRFNHRPALAVAGSASATDTSALTRPSPIFSSGSLPTAQRLQASEASYSAQNSPDGVAGIETLDPAITTAFGGLMAADGYPDSFYEEFRSAPDDGYANLAPELQVILANSQRLAELCNERSVDLDDSISLDELATKLFGRIRSMLRGDLLIDRERAGLLADFT